MFEGNEVLALLTDYRPWGGLCAPCLPLAFRPSAYPKAQTTTEYCGTDSLTCGARLRLILLNSLSQLHDNFGFEYQTRHAM
jgi:hypothetical protein